MKFLPIFLDVNDRPCVVVGGGKVAARKVALLKRAGADITVVSPVLCKELTILRDEGGIHHEAREFDDQDIQSGIIERT